MLTEFYIPLSAVCFTLFGLWLVVAATRQAEWRQSSLRQRRAFAVATHFSLPGLMSLLVLVNPHIVGQLSFPIAPERIAAVLLTGVVFAGANVAWLLLFENAEPDPQPDGTPHGARAG